MKNLILLLLPLLGMAACNKSEPTLKSLNVTETQVLIKNKAATLQIVDLRTPEEIVNTGTLQGAVVMDFTTPGFEQLIDVIDKKKPVLLYCASGVRSARAANLMVEKGYKEVYQLASGMNGWKAAGNPTVPVK